MRILTWPARLAVVLALSLTGVWSCSQGTATHAPTATVAPARRAAQANATTSSSSATAADRTKPLSLAPEPDVIEDARATLTYLASDELEGRGVGTHGLDVAADYIAGRFRSLGLQPPKGRDNYFQPFEYTVSSELGPDTSLALNGKSLEPNKDFQPVGLSHEGAFQGGIVFVGYGISEPEKFKYDDYADIDVKGKVVIV